MYYILQVISIVLLCVHVSGNGFDLSKSMTTSLGIGASRNTGHSKAFPLSSPTYQPTGEPSVDATESDPSVDGTKAPAGVVCEDGVCRLPHSHSMTEHAATADDLPMPTVQAMEDDPNVDEIMKLGWSSADAKRALTACNNSVEAAVDMLTAEDEKQALFVSLVDELENKYYWGRDNAVLALKDADMNMTLALEMLETEEAAQLEEFDRTVSDMVENGWDEFIARQALLAQYKIEAKRTAGMNETVSRDILSEIRPTLRRVNETESKSSTNNAKPSDKPAAKGSKKKSSTSETKPAKKEDCVFEVNTSNLQKIVIESPVPVLLDLYADWCGPCKQLTPMLEGAAMKSGGMFRLAKVNVDNSRDIVDAVGATGFPTVFAMNNGKFTDRFVGLIQGEDLQQFLVRAVTGYGERVQEDISEAELDNITNTITNMAGMAALTFKKKEKLHSLIDSALSEDAWTAQGTLSDPVQSALLYIKNAAKDIRNNKFRVIKVQNRIFKEKIRTSSSAMRILSVAGFRENNSNVTDPNVDGNLVLQHNNVAILTLLLQRVQDNVKQKKFSKSKQPALRPSPSPSSMPTYRPSSESMGDIGQITVALKPMSKGHFPIKMQFPSTAFVRDVVDELSRSGAPKTLGSGSGLSLDDMDIEVRYPLPRKTVALSLGLTLADLAGDKSELVLAMIPKTSRQSSSSSSSEISEKSIPIGKLNKRQSVVSGFDKSTSNKRKRSTNTLFSTGILDRKAKKHNEYFGGDSTVVLAGDDNNDANNSPIENTVDQGSNQVDSDAETLEEESDMIEEDDKSQNIDHDEDISDDDDEEDL